MANEKRLIDANDAEKFAREHILDAKERFLILDFLRERSTVDAVEVVHGRWIPCENGGYNCANCDRRVAFLVHNRYCPNCGAKMDGGVSSD